MNPRTEEISLVVCVYPILVHSRIVVLSMGCKVPWLNDAQNLGIG